MRIRQKHIDSKIIDKYGGVSAVRDKLGLTGLDGYRRVHNWVYRGIPPSVKLENPWLINEQKAVNQ